MLVNTRSVMQPVLENATNRALREKVWRSYVMRGDNRDANDTNATIAQILKLRQQRAELLGFKTHAHLRMDDTMAKDPARAMDLMMKVWPAAVARVKQEVADMQAVADSEGAGLKIEPWDYRFYSEKVRKAKYDLDQNEIKPYFQLNKMIAGMFDAAGKLYDLEFKENTGEVPVFHPDVTTYVVTNKLTGENVGLFYMDAYARTGKRSGAWATSYRAQQRLGGDRNVLASNNNNFVKPAPGEPALISLDDASTLFHEFGHALHSLLTDVEYPGLRGTPRDFVEYPSQVNENWLLTPYILENYATHYKTGEPIPAELVAEDQRQRDLQPGLLDGRISVVGDRRHEAAQPHRSGRRSARVRNGDAGRNRHAHADGDAPSPAAVRPSVLVGQLFGGLLQLSVVGDDGRRHLGRVRGIGRCVEPRDRRPLPQDVAVHRQRDRAGRGVPRVPRARSGRECAAQAARLPDHDGSRCRRRQRRIATDRCTPRRLRFGGRRSAKPQLGA